jgi:GAF domain-containing protein
VEVPVTHSVNQVALTLAQELAEMSRLVEDDDVTGTLRRFLARVTETVPGCDHATVTISSSIGTEQVGGTAESDAFDQVSDLAAVPGPVAEALTHREPRRLEDASTDQRWPDFSARLTAAGYRSCLALPLPSQRASTAVLTLFSRRAHQFDETVHDIVLLLTLHAGVVFDNAQVFHDSRRLVERLTTALRTRQTIGQAEGLLMHRFGCSADAGFELLKNASQHTNVKLREVASSLISAHERNKLGAALVIFGLPVDPDQTEGAPVR